MLYATPSPLQRLSQRRTADVVVRDVAVVEHHAHNGQPHYDEARQTRHAVEQVVAAPHKVDNQTANGVECAMHHRRHHHRARLQHEV